MITINKIRINEWMSSSLLVIFLIFKHYKTLCLPVKSKSCNGVPFVSLPDIYPVFVNIIIYVT